MTDERRCFRRRINTNTTNTVHVQDSVQQLELSQVPGGLQQSSQQSSNCVLLIRSSRITWQIYTALGNDIGNSEFQSLSELCIIVI